MPADPWAARPDLRPWCARLPRQAVRWRPDPVLRVDPRSIVDVIEQAAAAGEPWLAHPCLNRLTYSEVHAAAARDVCLVTWIAAHTNVFLGEIVIDRPMWRWSKASEPIAVPPGRHELARLVATDKESAENETVTVDPCCRSLGFALPDSWSEVSDRAETSRLNIAIRDMTQAYSLLPRFLPACASWATAVTRVVVPIRSAGATWSSGSHVELPGLIQVSGLNGPVSALEGLVHEAAHHHFTMQEASGPLTDPDHNELYPSPLRPDPRPLRSVFLAVHALGHIIAFYDEGIEAGLLHAGWAGRRHRLAALMRLGLDTLLRGHAHLTPPGKALLANAPMAVPEQFYADSKRP